MRQAIPYKIWRSCIRVCMPLKQIFQRKTNSSWSHVQLSKESTEKLSSKSLKNILEALDSMEVEWTLDQTELSKKGCRINGEI